MKKILSVLLGTLILASLFGCGTTKTSGADQTTPPSSASTSTAASSSPSPSEPSLAPLTTPLNETITFWYCYTDKVQENNENLTKEFNDTVGKQLGITVKAEYQGDAATLAQKLKAAYVAGTAPAVSVMDISTQQPFVDSGALQPLDAYIARDKDDVKMDDFQPGFLADSTFDGRVYSMPYLRSTPILYLNTTLLQQAGLDPKGPATLDELAQYARTIKEKTGKYGIAFFPNAWMFQALMMEQGSSLYNDDGTATNINSDASKKILTLISALRDDGSLKVITSSQANTILADVTAQNIGMWYYSTGGLTTLMGVGQKNGFGVTAVPLPKGTVAACPTGGSNLVMTSKLTDHQKEAAWQFIKWMTEKEQAIKATTTTGYLPTRISVVNEPTMQALFKKIPEFQTCIDQLKVAGGKTHSTTEADAAIVSALDSILVNKADIDKTLAELETKVNGLLKQK